MSIKAFGFKQPSFSNWKAKMLIAYSILWIPFFKGMTKELSAQWQTH